MGQQPTNPQILLTQVPTATADIILFTLQEMRASGSWDANTLDRAIGLAQAIIRDSHDPPAPPAQQEK